MIFKLLKEALDYLKTYFIPIKIKNNFFTAHEDKRMLLA